MLHEAGNAPQLWLSELSRLRWAMCVVGGLVDSRRGVVDWWIRAAEWWIG